MLSKQPRMSPSSTHVALILVGQHEEALPNGVCRASARTKAVGVFVRGGLGDGFQRQQMQCLHGAVFHRRDAQRPQLSVGLRNVDTSQRLRLITAPPQRADGFVFGRRGVPYFPVHPGRSPALIVRHPFHGQGFAGKRAGQQPLQGFHLAPAVFLSCLDDTRLQPSDLTFTLSPVKLFPSDRLAGGCTRSFSLRSFAISSCEGSASSLVTNDPLEVCPFARRSDVATPVRSITERPSLFPASSARHPVSVPCGRACPAAGAECRVYNVSFQ